MEPKEIKERTTFKIDEALDEIKKSKKKFKQSIDIVINLQNFDPKKQENKVSKEIVLPNGIGKDVKIGIISDTRPGSITKAQIEALKEKKQMKKFLEEYDSFLADPSLMPFVGKTLGKYLAPKGRMPTILPPNANSDEFVRMKKKAIRFRTRDSSSIQLLVGNEEMGNAELKENIKKVLEDVQNVLPKGRSQMKNVLVKMTMSKPVKIEF